MANLLAEKAAPKKKMPVNLLADELASPSISDQVLGGLGGAAQNYLNFPGAAANVIGNLPETIPEEGRQIKQNPIQYLGRALEAFGRGNYNTINKGLQKAGLSSAPEHISPHGKSNIAETLSEIGGQYAPLGPPAALAAAISPVLGGLLPFAGHGAIHAPKGKSLENAIEETATLGPLKLIGPGINQFRPQRYAERGINELRGGATPQENAMMTAENIHQQYQPIKQENANEFGHIINNSDLSGTNTPSMRHFVPQEISELESGVRIIPRNLISEEQFNNLSVPHRRQLEALQENPSVEQMHFTRADFDRRIRKLENQEQTTKHALSGTQLNELHALQQARSALDNEVVNALWRANPELPNQYRGAQQNFEQNVLPYQHPGGLYELAEEGARAQPSTRQLDMALRDPETKKLQPVVENMSDSMRNRIMANMLHEKLGLNANAGDIAKALKEGQNKKYAAYTTPQTEKLVKGTEKKLRNKEVAGKSIEALAAAIAGGMLLGPVGAGVAALLPSAFRGIKK